MLSMCYLRSSMKIWLACLAGEDMQFLPQQQLLSPFLEGVVLDHPMGCKLQCSHSSLLAAQCWLSSFQVDCSLYSTIQRRCVFVI